MRYPLFDFPKLPYSLFVFCFPIIHFISYPHGKMFFFFPADIPPSAHASIHELASLVLGAFIIVVLMRADPDC